MAITMQRAWTVTVKTKNASFNQRFVISGATSGNGTYAGTVGTSAFVTGAQWSINVQHQAGNGQPWIDSRQRIGTPATSGGLVRVDIRTDDGGGSDADFDDLVLTCSMPVSSSDFIVYGSARTYQGRCLFNPCYPHYRVIDSPAALAAALQVPNVRSIIKKLYPEAIPHGPGPNPPPGPYFTPLVLPTGTPTEQSGLVFRSTAAKAAVPEAEVKSEKDVRKLQEASVTSLRGSAQPVTFDGSPVGAGVSLLERSELLSLAKLNDKISRFPTCTVTNAPGLLLNFLEYDRTDTEKLGGAYTGTGTKEALGLAVTDELGNYLFRFSRSLADIADETADVGTGELVATQIFPDVIVQALGSGMEVDYESAPYYNIPNLYRIDLCLPSGTVHPSTNTCAAFDRTIVKIGDIITLHSALSGLNTLDPDGRITCRNVNAPQVDCAAWRNIGAGGRVGLSVYGCLPTNVSTYTVRYKRLTIDADWQFVDESLKLNHIPEFAIGYTGTSVGPILNAVKVDGGLPVTRPTYENHQGDSNWIENDLKIVLDTTRYGGPAGHATVQFRIQGYDSGGNLVATTDDTIPLYIDNNPSKGSIKNVNTGAPAVDDCALLALPAADSPITVQYTIDNPEGFLHSWALSVTRGNNAGVPVVASGVVPRSYPAAGLVDPCAFHGTDDFAQDADGFTETVLQPSPSGSTWLPPGKTFCAFAFTLSATDRVTDGRNAYPQTVSWQDLVGMSFTPPAP